MKNLLVNCNNTIAYCNITRQQLLNLSDNYIKLFYISTFYSNVIMFVYSLKFVIAWYLKNLNKNP